MAEFPTDMRAKLSASRTAKTQEQRLWDLGLRFLEGRQWLRFDKNLDQYVASRSREGQAKVTVNLLLNIYRNVLSRLELSYPSVVVLPASPSSEDVVKAQSSEAALKYYWSSNRMENVLGEAVRWLLTTGTCALHSYYDPDDQTVKTDTFGAYDIFFERGVNSPDDSQWIAVRTFHPRKSLEEAYPDKKEMIEKAGIVNENDYSSFYNSDFTGPPVDRVEVFEIYWRDGKHAIMVGDGYLYKEDKVPVGILPIQIIRYTEVPRRLWGVSLIAPLLDLQLLYNKARSQIIHNVELMGNPKWVIPKTAGVSNNSITSRPGEKIYYNPAGGRPEQISPSPLPSYIIDNVQRLQSEMGDVAGLHSVSLGKRAVGVTSGKAIEALASQDTSQLQGSMAAIERGVSKMASVVLQLMKAYYTEEKMMRMLDSYGQVTFRAIQATDLVEDPEIFIEAGSLFRNEAQDRDTKVLELLQMGLIPPDMALQELSFRTGNAFVSKKVAAMAHAQEILQLVKEGVGDPQILRNDDLQAFEQVFSDFMKTGEYYDLDMAIQDKIMQVLVAVVAGQQNLDDMQYGQLLAGQVVYPRPPQPPQMGPMGAGAQIQGQTAPGAQQPGSIAGSERAGTNRAEAMISPAPGGVV
jgi:hypothetical protein